MELKIDKHIDRGFFAIGIHHGKTEENFGMLIRSAVVFKANYVFTIGRRYKKHGGAVGLDRHIPIFHFATFEEFHKNIPMDCKVVCVEQAENAESLVTFKHPDRAIYLLGSEYNGIPPEVMQGFRVVQIPGIYSLNVAVSGALVMYDRVVKRK
jgi:tRNA G18 (ribose-2'-O)-methylase SpoU